MGSIPWTPKEEQRREGRGHMTKTDPAKKDKQFINPTELCKAQCLCVGCSLASTHLSAIRLQMKTRIGTSPAHLYSPFYAILELAFL